MTETGSATASAQYSLDSGAFTPLTLDASGNFDVALAATALAAGAHSVTVKASDTAGGTQQQTINFTVTSSFLTGAAGTAGWGEATPNNTDIHLEERNSLLVQYSVPVALDPVAAGTRTISFQVAPQFDRTDTTALAGDRLAVSLVDPSSPGTVLLAGDQAGAPLFELGETGAAEFPSGLVSFDGTTVTIDVTSVTAPATGLLVFQLLGGDTDSGTTVDIENLADSVNPNGVSSPTMPAISPVAPGAALDLSTLTAQASVQAQLSDVTLNPATGAYTADLRVMNNGAALGRDIAVVLSGMPAGVTFPGASGTDGSGDPYINMHDAIPAGGLAAGAMSSPVAITLSDPALTQFALTAQVLGGPELAPTLAPIGNLTAMPGQVLDVPLSATDPNGDPITFTLQSTEANGALPTSTLEPGGTLVISPAPSDVGTFHFNVVASDGSQQATQPVTLTVTADPNTDTRVSGFVLATTGAPLPGETITLDGLTATTGSDGSFLLDFGNNPPPSSDRLSVGSIVQNGQTIASVAEVMSLLLGHEVYSGVNNVISRPIFLPALNLAQGAMVNPAQNTTVTPAAIPGASLFVQANTLVMPNGQPYNGILSVTQVPVDQTPAALPADLKPTLVVTIQPGGMTFTTPAPITLPNPGYAPGTIMNLWSISSATGEFAIAGTGQVSADGSVINTISGGVHLSSWHFFAPPPPPTPPDPPDDPPNDCPVPGGSTLDLFTGAVTEQYSLPSYQSLGTTQTVTLNYDSTTADAAPIVRVGYDSIDTSSFTTFDNVVLMAQLTVQEGESTYVAPGYTGTSIPGLTGGEQFWSVPTNGGSAYATFQVNMQGLPTGIYDYSMLSGFFGFSSTTHFAVAGSYATTNGQIFLVNQADSPFGAGWNLAGLESVYRAADGSVMLVDGGGMVNIFQPPATTGGAYVSQAGDFSTLVKLADGTFQRTLTDGTVDHFNSSGQLATITDRDGNVTTYAYNASGDLLSVTNPVGQVTTFAYTGSHITAITDPAGRVTQLAYDAAGNLVMITNPDGSHTEYQYDAEHHLIGETDPLGNQGHDIYDAFGRAAMSIRKDGSVVYFNPVQVQGLQAPGGPFDPFNAPAAGTNTGSYTDGDGHVTDVTFDYAGNILAQADGEGSLGTSQLDSSFQPTTITDGNGFETLYTYDANGNVTSTSYQFSGNITGQIFNPGDTFVYTFKGTPGQTFFYDGLATSAAGINAQLTGPAGNSVFNIQASSNSGLITLEAAGTYQLIIAGNSATTGAYDFHLYTPTLTTSPLPFGTPVTNTIANPGDAFAYTFTGTPGERIFYNSSTTPVGNQQVELIDPFGNPVFNTNWSNPEGPVVLTQTGTYTLVLFGNGDTTGSYNFVVTNPALDVAPLAFGMPVTGTINAGDDDEYTFSGTAGERFFYNPSTTGIGNQQAQLLDPFGNIVYNTNWSNPEGPVVLTQSGTYTFLLFGNGNTTGTYDFVVSNPVLTTTRRSPSALPATGTINAGDDDEYTFSGTAGERFFYNPSTVAAGNQQAELYDPFGNTVFNTNWSNPDGPTVLTQSGTYTFLLFGNSNTTGTYNFVVTNPTLTTTALAFNTPTTGSINPGDQAAYTFTGAPGQQIYYDAFTPGIVYQQVQLYDPFGNTVYNTNWSNDEGPVTLTQSGTYTLLFYGNGNAAGTYAFQVLNAASQPAVALGAPTMGTLNPGTSAAIYQVSGTAGQRLLFHSLATGNAQWTLYDPSDQIVQGANTNVANDFTATLAVTGTYLLVISGNSGSPVPYSFQVTDVSDAAETPSSNFGMAQSGTIAAGQVANFSYTAPAGLEVALDAQVPAPSNLTIELLDPYNNVVFSNSASSNVGGTILQRGGTYTLKVQGSTAAATGSYQFNLLDLAADATALTLGMPVSDSLAANTFRTYQFTGTVGAPVFYDGLTGSGIGASLDGPSGNVFNVNVSSPNGPHILPASGTYTLTIYTNGGSGPYSFTLFNPAAPVAPLALGTPIMGSLANPGDQALYSFTGTAGERVFYNATVNSSGIDAMLVDPFGNQVFIINANGQNGPYTLPQTGNFTLTIYGTGNATGLYGFNLRQPAPAPVVASNYVLGTPVMSALANPGDQAIYTFSGTAGERVFYNALVNSSGIDAILVDPFGNQVFNINANAQNGPYTLPQTGNFTLTIYGSGNATGSYGFNFRQPAPIPVVPSNYVLGTPVMSSLANPGDQAIYTFSGTAGERVFYNALVNSSGIDAILVDPFGNQVFNTNANAQTGPYALPRTGTYTLTIYGSGNATGSYGFNLRQPAPIPAVPSNYVLGTPVMGSLANPGDQAIYAFSGTAGERITYDALIPSDGSIDVEVVTPSGGQLINENAFSDAGFTLPVAGTYTVVVYGSGSATGNYSFELEDVDAAPTVPLGTTVTGTLSPGLSDASYQFAGKAGQVLYFQHLGSDNNGRWDLYYDPTDPTFVNGVGLASDFEVTLPSSGTYVLVLSGQQSTNAAVDYSFQIITPATSTSPVGLGATVQGNLAQPGATASYTFLGSVGQRLVYDALQASTPGLNVTLKSPSGATLYQGGAANEPVPQILAEAGTYTLTLSGNGNSTGTYAFRLLDAAAATALAVPQPGQTSPSVAGTLSPGLADVLYSFSGSAGQALSFNSQFLAVPGAAGNWFLYGPEDQFIAQGPGLASTFTANLPTAGTYVLVLAGTSASAPVNYQFTVSNNSQQAVAPSGFNTVQSGTIAAAQTVPFTFAAPAGLPIYFDGETGTGSLVAVLRDPSGNQVFSANAASDAGPYILTASGNYVLTVSGTSLSATGTVQFQMLDLKNGSTPLALNTPTSGSLSPGTAAVSYSLAVPVGQRVVYNALTSANSGVEAILYSAGGAVILNTNANNDSASPITLLAGSYTLILAGTKAATSAYSFQLLNANTAPALPIDTGAVTGTLTPGTEATLYSISGVQGESLYLHPTGAPGSGSWAIYRTGNQTIADTGLDNDLVLTFPTTGTYLLALFGASTSGSISDDFSAHLVNTVTEPIPTTATVSGTTTYTYDPTFNEVTSETDPLGRQTLYQIDPANGNVLSVTQVGTGGASNLVTTYTYDSHGLVTKEIDPAGRETDYTYDQLERLIKVTYAVGTPDAASVEYTYDLAGNILTTTNADNQTTTNTHDALNRLLTTTDPLGNTTTNTYDAAGNLITTKDALGNATTYVYDTYGHMIKETDATGGVTTSTYDAAGNLTSVTDPLGNTTRYQYDARDRLTTTTDAAGNVTRQVYDGDNNVLAVIDPDGNQTTYAYDGLDRLVRVTDAVGNATLYSYDADGEVVSTTDGNGQVITYAYDGAGRRVTETWKGTSEVITTTYNADGQVTSVSDPNSSLTYTYDALGRVVTVDNAGTPNAPHVVLTYTYDPAGNVLSTADTVNGVAEGLNSYTYDANNEMTQVIQTGAALQTKRVDFTYNPVGAFATIERYSNAAGTQLVAGSTYTYDSLNRLTGLTDSNGTSTLATYALSYDANSLITKVVDSDGTSNYSYDALGQLTGATYSNSTIPSESYTYDANGNRLTSGTSTTYQVGPGNQLLSDGTYSYQYDNDGNVILRTTLASGATESYAYDARNRLVTVIDRDAAGAQTQAVSYTYDGLNRRISAAVTTAAGTTTTYFVYDGSSNVLLEFQSSAGSQAPVLTEHNLFGPAVDQILAQDAGAGKVSWLLADDLGSIRDVVNSAGAEIDHLVYDSYGNLLSQTNPAAPPDYEFAGREFDTATGLYFDQARYYDPQTTGSGSSLKARSGSPAVRPIFMSMHITTRSLSATQNSDALCPSTPPPKPPPPTANSLHAPDQVSPISAALRPADSLHRWTPDLYPVAGMG